MFNILTFFSYLLLFILLFLCFVYLFFTVIIYGYWRRRGIPDLDPSFPLGNMKKILFAEESMNTHFWKLHEKIKGPYAGIYLVNKPVLMLKDPDIIKQVLIKDFSNFQDRSFYCDEEKEPLSGHLFRLSGERWRYMRSKLSPAFTLGKLKMMFETMVNTGKQFENYLSETADKGESIQIKDYTMRYSADIIASVIFGIETNSFKNDKNKWWQIVCTLIYKTTFLRHAIFCFVMLAPDIIRLLRLSSLFHLSNVQIFELVKEVVEYREKNKITRNDFMQLLIQLKNQGEVNADDNVKNTDVYNKTSVKGLSVYEISAQAYTMFFAGFDTSATTMHWVLYLLAKHLDAQQKVHEEIDRVLKKTGGELTYDSLQEMNYLDMVICESLRMYPILGFTNRVPHNDYKIPNTRHVIEKGTPVYISILGLHRDPQHFPNPDKFDPERFSPENKIKIKSGTYMPFGDGPRNCIGKRFGQLQTAVGLVMVLRKHSVRLTKDCPTGEVEMDRRNFSYIPLKAFTLKIHKRK